MSDAADQAASAPRTARRNVVLVADDYAISGGVSAGIETLARARRISGASAIVTMPRWRQDARRLAALRANVAIGLHVNLTLAAPLGTMRKLAPRGLLPGIGVLAAAAAAQKIDADEIASEIRRQLDAFECETGFAPDFIDGHQHAHALPAVRDGLLAALSARFADRATRPLVRVPFATLEGTARSALGKAVLVAGLSLGFKASVARSGLPSNDTFAGFSLLNAGHGDVSRDFAAAATASRGGLHLVMCHPGVPTRELAELDPVQERRAAELALLGRDNALTTRLWHPLRDSDGPAIDWRREQEAMS